MSVEETEAAATQPPEPQPQAPDLGDTMRELEDRFAPKIEEARQQLNLFNQRAKSFIRENPGTTLLCAVGVGYLIGKLASRK